MLGTATYEIELRIDGQLIGNVSRIAQNLKWVRRRTKVGADEIDFTVNDVLFQKWLKERKFDINTVLKPLALDCRVIRDGVAVCGGFLATMPSYQPRGTSADLALRFDGYLNLLAGVYISPIGTVNGRMGELVRARIAAADSKASNAGKAFGFTQGTISTMNSVTHTFDNYKTVKEFITDRCDNTSGAGPFDVYFHPDRTYDILSDSNFGEVITDWTAYYPTRLNGVSATSISASEVQGFASAVLGIGAGEVSSDATQNTAITTLRVDSSAVAEFGYAETLMQDSSVSLQSTLNNNANTLLSETSNPIWQPQITLSGRQISPIPSGEGKIWLGDTITIVNEEDLTGMTSGAFRVNELSVSREPTGAESINPILERVV